MKFWYNFNITTPLFDLNMGPQDVSLIDPQPQTQRATGNHALMLSFFQRCVLAGDLRGLFEARNITSSEVKGGAYSVTLHLYRRAIAGEIARGLSMYKGSRLHFVRGTKEEAARVAEEAKNHFESGRQTDGNGFSARHSRREYGYYE